MRSNIALLFIKIKRSRSTSLVRFAAAFAFEVLLLIRPFFRCCCFYYYSYYYYLLLILFPDALVIQVDVLERRFIPGPILSHDSRL